MHLASGHVPSAVCREQLILGGCPCSTLFTSGLIDVCQATAELGTCWWAGEACVFLFIWQVLILWVGHMPGWEILCARAAGRTKHWAWETESSEKEKEILKTEGTGIYIPSGNSQGEQSCDAFLSVMRLHLGPSISWRPLTPTLNSLMAWCTPIPTPL